MSTSEFVTHQESATKSITSIVVIDKKKRFKKQLAHAHKDSLRHRMSMYKEFEIGQQINCPYIVRYIGINEDENGMYVLMEHINGMNISEKIKAEPEYFHNHRHTEKMLRQLLEALQALHRRNIAYLDLKPENVMLTQISNDVRLTDLGGCFTDSNDYTAERTASYAAPELMDDDVQNIDARTDLYGIGKLLQYIEEKSESKLPRHLERIKKRCLNEDKTKRYATTDDVIKVLKRRHRTIWSTAAAIICIIASFIGWQKFVGTEPHKQLLLYLNNDAKIEGIYFKISSEEKKTCKVLGQSDSINLYITERVKIGNNIYTTTEITDSAFCRYEEIESVFLPKTLQRIGEKAFYDCKQIASATIPEGITTIETKCFKGSGIKNLKLPRSLKKIGHASFARCKRLKHVVIPEGTEVIGLDAFANCDSLESIQLPSTLNVIDRGVFWMCFSLREITIPAGVNTIGEYVFYDCHQLRDIYNYAFEPQDLSIIIRKNDTHKVTVHVPAASVEKYRNAHHWKDMNIVGDL